MRNSPANVCASLFVCAQFACGSADHAPSSPAPHDGGAQPMRDAAAHVPPADAASHDGSAPPALAVSLTATATELCPGECTTLSASARDGAAPYHFAWSDGAADQATRELCPETSGTYTVTASDTGERAGEFGAESSTASADIDITVRASCNPGATVCSTRIAYVPPNALVVYAVVESQAMLRTDARGSAILVGGFQGSIDFGGGLVTSRGSADVFVLKLDADCGFLWVRTFGTPNQGGGASAVAITPDDGMVVVGSAPLQAFDDSVAADTFGSFALALDAAGEVLWSRGYVSPGNASDVAADDAGNVVFSGYGPPSMNFGSGAIGGAAGSLGVGYVASLDAQGAHRYAHALVNASEHAPLDVYPTGEVVLSGAGAFRGDVGVAGGAFPIPDYGGAQFVARLDARGRFVSAGPVQRMAPAGAQVRPRLGGGASVVRAPDGGVVLDVGVFYVENASGPLPDPQRVLRLDAAGAPQWERARAYLGDDMQGAWSTLAVDGRGSVLLGDQIGPGARLDGAALNVNGQTDILLEKLSPSGDPLWHRQLGGAGYDWQWALATDRAGNVWEAHIETEDAQRNRLAAVITKIEP